MADIRLVNSITPAVAGKILNLGVQSVQGALIAGVLPIGCAWKNPDSTTYKYYISAAKLADFCGITKQDVIDIMMDE